MEQAIENSCERILRCAPLSMRACRATVMRGLDEDGVGAERHNPESPDAGAMPSSHTRDTLPALPGTYVLCLRCAASKTIAVGRRGSLELCRGVYLYVGSARGPGGLAARLGRHLGGSLKHRWHIDYLRAVTKPVGAWLAVSPDIHEHRWAAALANTTELSTIDAFGASDCRCKTHLLYAQRLPAADFFETSLAGSVCFVRA